MQKSMITYMFSLFLIISLISEVRFADCSPLCSEADENDVLEVFESDAESWTGAIVTYDLLTGGADKYHSNGKSVFNSLEEIADSRETGRGKSDVLAGRPVKIGGKSEKAIYNSNCYTHYLHDEHKRLRG